MLRARSRLVESFTHILRSDPAVDSGCDDFEAKWEVYLDGAGDPPLKPGEKPAVWTLRILGTKEQVRLSEYSSRASDDRHKLSGLIAAAFGIGLVSVEGLLDADGKALSVIHTDDDGLPIVANQFIDNLEPSWVFELGGRVIARMNANPK